jgi:hypothetical protein
MYLNMVTASPALRRNKCIPRKAPARALANHETMNQGKEEAFGLAWRGDGLGFSHVGAWLWVPRHDFDLEREASSLERGLRQTRLSECSMGRLLAGRWGGKGTKLYKLNKVPNEGLDGCVPLGELWMESNRIDRPPSILNESLGY